MSTQRVTYTTAEALAYHKDRFSGNGKIEVIPKVPYRNTKDLTLAYSPGVAEPCSAIAKDPALQYHYTNKGNFVAIVTDGTAVLGLGDIGPKAAQPVMEGKSVLFKALGGVDAFPLCLDTQDTDEIVETVIHIAPVFGGINLEDISAPRCFDILARLEAALDIPVFHDDQHGSAVVTLAALLNALKVVGKKAGEVRIAMNGAGASAIATAEFLMNAGFRDVTLCDRKGIIYEGRKENMNPYKERIARVTNRERRTGSLAEAMRGADVFIGLSAADQVTPQMVRSMAKDPIIIAMANPVPEIHPDAALEAGARIVATGRSDYPNQVNNVLGFPGIFRGALSARAHTINQEMMMAAAHALAGAIPEDELREDFVIVSPLAPGVIAAEARAVARAAVKTGVARIPVDPDRVAADTTAYTEAIRERYEQFDQYLLAHQT
ncbi:MAG: NAD-dependent malic enzyme [Candidatus Tectomicrobia bacterium]|nr:NAD-dependent malic enzyme [Candidatus Tectomicrobia bacterium]